MPRATKNGVTVLAVTAGLIALACGPEDTGNRTQSAPADPPASGTGLMRGTVAISADGPILLPCGSTDTLRVNSASGLRPVLALRADSAPVFVLVAARPGKQTDLMIERVLYASTDRFECFSDWSGFRYRATGNQPGWVVEVFGDAVELRREGDQSFTWSGVQIDSTAASIRITAPGENDRALELILQLRDCHNAATGAYAAWSARLVAGRDPLSGCAVPGTAGTRP